jgi:hypothetical protein
MTESPCSSGTARRDPTPGVAPGSAWLDTIRASTVTGCLVWAARPRTVGSIDATAVAASRLPTASHARGRSSEVPRSERKKTTASAPSICRNRALASHNTSSTPPEVDNASTTARTAAYRWLEAGTGGLEPGGAAECGARVTGDHRPQRRPAPHADVFRIMEHKARSRC